MAYSDFTFPKLKAKFGIVQREALLFDNGIFALYEPSESLKMDIEMAKLFSMLSEKARSEAIIFPIMRELKRSNAHISIFSGYTFNIDAESGLTGAPDFLISAKSGMIDVQCPVFCLMESKNKTPDEGFAQCAAEMYAARLFNQQTGEPYETIYGAVTNAFEWVFMKLEGDTVYIDTERYYLNELPKVLGILQHIINLSTQK